MEITEPANTTEPPTPAKTYQVNSLGPLDPDADLANLIEELEARLALDYYPASLICKPGYPAGQNLTAEAAQALIEKLATCGIRSMMIPMPESTVLSPHYQYIPPNTTIPEIKTVIPVWQRWPTKKILSIVMLMGALAIIVIFYLFDPHPPKTLESPVISTATNTPAPAVKPNNPLRPHIQPALPATTPEQSLAKEYEVERQHRINQNLNNARAALNKKDIAAALEFTQRALDDNPDLAKARYLLRKILESYAQAASRAVREYDIETANNLLKIANTIQTQYPSLKIPELDSSQQQLATYYQLKQHLTEAKADLAAGNDESCLQHLTTIQQIKPDFPEYPDIGHQLAERYLLQAEKMLIQRNPAASQQALHQAQQISRQFELQIPALERRQQQLQSWGQESLATQKTRYIGKPVTIYFVDGRSLSGMIIALDNTTIVFQRLVSGILSTHQIDWLEVLKIE